MTEQRTTKERAWNRCDECKRFIPFADFESGRAIRRMVTPDSDQSREAWETYCADHAYLRSADETSPTTEEK